MNDLFDILGVERDFSGDWIELLVPVIIVIVYAISGILRMRSTLEKELPAEDEQEPGYESFADLIRGRQAPSSEPAVPEMSPARRRQIDRQIERKLVPESTPAGRPGPTRPHQRRTLDTFLETGYIPGNGSAEVACRCAETGGRRAGASPTTRRPDQTATGHGNNGTKSPSCKGRRCTRERAARLAVSGRFPG